MLITNGGIGDAVHVIPSIKCIRSHFGPDVELILQAVIHDSAVTKPHLTLADQILLPLDLVNKVCLVRYGISNILSHWWNRIHFSLSVVGWVLNPTIDLVIFLFPDPPKSRRIRLLNLLSRLSYRIVLPRPITQEKQSFERSPFAWQLLDSVSRTLSADMSRVANDTPLITLPDSAVREADRWLCANRRYPDRWLLAVCPGASNPSNEWPTERFINLLLRLQDQTQLEIVLVGGSTDLHLCQEIAWRCPGVLDACGALTILGSAALFRRTRLMVGLDTGTTHLASACGVPYVALYGQRGAGRKFFPPFAKGVVLRQPVPCRGCGLHVCDQEGHPCMTGINVDDVLNAVIQVASISVSAA